MLIVAIIAIVLYTLCGVAWLRAWQPTRMVFACGVAAVLMHTLFTVNQSYHAGAINFSLFSVSNIISVCITLMVLGISMFLAIQKLAAPLFLLAAVNIVMTLLSGNSAITPISVSIAAHVLPSIIAYSLFSLAAAIACLLAIAHRSLKQHKPLALIPDLPPIDVIEKMLITIILIAYLLLSASILSGFITIDDFFGQKLAHKTVFSILAWLTYSILLYGHFVMGWRGTTAVKWTIGGFLFLMLGFFGTKLVLEVIL